MLRHELDWVVAKAMRHDRNDRYASAAALADDLQRFLDGKPLRAVPATRGYVWRKFMRRHRGALLAASVALVALLGGLGLSVYGLMQARAQRAIAEQRSTELEKVAAFQQSMLQGVDIEAMGVAMTDGLRQQVAKGTPGDSAALEQALAHASTADLARGLIDRNILAGAEAAIERDFGNEPNLAANLRESVAHVREALGLPEAAAEGYRQVADYRARALGASAMPTLQARQAQAGALLDAAQPKPALALLQRTLADAGVLAQDDPLRIKLELDVAEATAALGDRPRARSLLEALYARSVKARGERDPGSMDVQNNLAILLARMGEAKLGREAMERVVATRKQVLGAEHADTLGAMHNLATMRILTGDKDAAVALQRHLVAVQTRRIGSEHPQTLSERGNLASMLVDSGKVQEALPIAQSVVEARTRVLGADHPQTLRAKLNLATVYARLEQFDKTLPLQAEVAQARLRLLGPRHPDTIFILINQAGSLQQMGRSREALAAIERVLPLAVEVLGDHHPQAQAAMQIRADSASALGNHRLAIASFRDWFEARRKALGEGDVGTIDAAWQLEGELLAAGQREEAVRLRERYITPLLQAKPDSLSPELARMADNIRETEREEARQATTVTAKVGKG